MAECIVLLRMVMVGIVVGVFALTIMVGKMVNAAWHHLHQRRENLWQESCWQVLVLSGCW